MMKIKFLKAFISAVFLMIFISCEYETIEPIVVELPDEPISFSDEIQPIFTAKCIACHAFLNPNLSEGTAYTSLISGEYVNTEDPENSRLIVQIDTGHPGGSSNPSVEERAKILKWIEEGAQNN